MYCRGYQGYQQPDSRRVRDVSLRTFPLRLLKARTLALTSSAFGHSVEQLLYKHSVVVFPNRDDLTTEGQHKLTQRFDPNAIEYGHGKVGRPDNKSILHPDLRNSSATAPSATPTSSKVSLRPRDCDTLRIKLFTRRKFRTRTARKALRGFTVGIWTQLCTSATPRKLQLSAPRSLLKARRIPSGTMAELAMSWKYRSEVQHVSLPKYTSCFALQFAIADVSFVVLN